MFVNSKITIYRGSHQIGGCVTEIRTKDHRIRLINDSFCVTHVYIPELKSGIWDGRLPYGLPFSIGKQVKLEGPVFSEPLYGVRCGEECAGEWYNRMGYMEGDEKGNEGLLNVRNMGRHSINADELYVLDWFHSASREELPDSRSLLGEISKELCQVRERDGEKAAVRRFWEFFRI